MVGVLFVCSVVLVSDVASKTMAGLSPNPSG